MKPLIFVVSLLALLAASCHRIPEPVRLDGQAQGTYYTIIYYDDQQRNFQIQVDSILDAFDQEVSLWEENSLVRRINRNEDSVVTPIFADLLAKSQSICDYTDGAFDCRVGQLVAAWGFSFKQREELSSQKIDSMLAMARGEIFIQQNAHGEKYIAKQYPQTALDFNAIAQGYSVDMIAAWLREQGVENYLVDVGGEVIARGQKPDGSHWCVGIERPAADKYNAPEVEAVVNLDNMSVVTSGSYRKYYEKDGVKYSHTIDPRTGRPVQHSLLSVSVIDAESWRADALATAFMVMGKDKALEFVASHPDNPAVFFIYDEGGQMKTYATPEFEKLFSD